MTLFRIRPVIGEPVRACDAEALRLEALKARWRPLYERVATWGTPGTIMLAIAMLIWMLARIVAAAAQHASALPS